MNVFQIDVYYLQEEKYVEIYFPAYFSSFLLH